MISRVQPILCVADPKECLPIDLLIVIEKARKQSELILQLLGSLDSQDWTWQMYHCEMASRRDTSHEMEKLAVPRLVALEQRVGTEELWRDVDICDCMICSRDLFAPENLEASALKILKRKYSRKAMRRGSARTRRMTKSDCPLCQTAILDWRLSSPNSQFALNLRRQYSRPK